MDDRVTELLDAARHGQRAAFDELFPLVYDVLRHIAHRKLSTERKDHTLSTTDLVHEAYLKLVRFDRIEWQGRAHFLAIAAQAMRNRGARDLERPAIFVVYAHTHGEVSMRTNIVIDDDVLAEAFRVSEARTKKALVHEALRELVRMRRRKSLLDLKGRIRFAKGYDYRKLRAGR